MSRIAVDCFQSVTSLEGMSDLDARLPAKNSLRRASESSKAAVLAAADALRAAGLAVTDRVGVYVGEQQISLDYCAQFIDQSYTTGPRFTSPMLFSESVANIAATHLSLTLGFTGPLQTFIGTRAAGIQAVAAAREDLEAQTIDAALVVVLSFGHALTREAYGGIYFPRRPIASRPPLPFVNGAAAFVARRGGGGLELEVARTCSAGLAPEEQERAVRGLLGASGLRAASPSTFLFARSRSLEILRKAGLSMEDPVDLGGEAFALDPVLQLAKGRRAVLALGEDGTAGLICIR